MASRSTRSLAMRESISRAIVFGGAGFTALIIAQLTLARLGSSGVNADVFVMLAVAASFAACLIVGALAAFILLRRRLVSPIEAAVLGAFAAAPAAISGVYAARQIGFGGSLVVVALVAAAIAAVGGSVLHRRQAHG